MSKKLFFTLSPFLFVLGLSILYSSIIQKKVNIASRVENFSGIPTKGETKGSYHSKVVYAPEIILGDTKPVLGVSNSNEKWIEVDLSEQKLRAWDGSVLYLETLVSTGLPQWPTPTGEFRIWVKLRAARMEGGEGAYYYNLPNVPFIMFFGNDKVPNWRGFGLHGTYWHNDFGRVHSHGCVNLPTSVAEKFYYWITPTLSEGEYSVFSSPKNPGTRIVIHK